MYKICTLLKHKDFSFWKLFRLHLFVQYKTKYNSEIILQFKITVSYINIYYNVIYSCDGKAEISAAITPVLSITWSFRIQFNMMIWCNAQETFLIINVENINVFHDS